MENEEGKEVEKEQISNPEQTPGWSAWGSWAASAVSAAAETVAKQETDSNLIIFQKYSQGRVDLYKIFKKFDGI